MVESHLKSGAKIRWQGLLASSLPRTKKILSPPVMLLVITVCTDLSGKEAHRQVGMDKVVTSRSLAGVMVSTMAQNARDMGRITTLGTIFPIFITPTIIYLD